MWKFFFNRSWLLPRTPEAPPTAAAVAKSTPSAGAAAPPVHPPGAADPLLPNPHLPGFRRVVHCPPWCPGTTDRHVCNCGHLTEFVSDSDSSPSAPGGADEALPAAWYRGASPDAAAFWLELVVELTLTGAQALARDALGRGFDLQGLHEWCVDHGFKIERRAA